MLVLQKRTSTSPSGFSTVIYGTQTSHQNAYVAISTDSYQPYQAAYGLISEAKVPNDRPSNGPCRKTHTSFHGPRGG